MSQESQRVFIARLAPLPMRPRQRPAELVPLAARPNYQEDETLHREILENLGRSPSAEKHMSNVLAVEAREGPNTSFHGAFLACLHCDTNNNELRFLLIVDELVRTNTTRNALVGEFMVGFLLVFIASCTAVNSDLFIHRWHALQLVRRSSLISPRTGFNSICIRKESCTPCQQHVCVRWCHPLCRAPRFFRFHVVRMETCRILLCRYTDIF